MSSDRYITFDDIHVKSGNNFNDVANVCLKLTSMVEDLGIGIGDAIMGLSPEAIKEHGAEKACEMVREALTKLDRGVFFSPTEGQRRIMWEGAGPGVIVWWVQQLVDRMAEEGSR